MKAQQLDQLRGYRKDTYGEVQQVSETEYVSEDQAFGAQVLREPLWNRGTFSHSHVAVHVGLFVLFVRGDNSASSLILMIPDRPGLLARAACQEESHWPGTA